METGEKKVKKNEENFRFLKKLLQAIAVQRLKPVGCGRRPPSL
tara:strand:+ start:159 stop:287 length:129 start_codon:yes stop_codon:yes gene_type:complete